MPRIRTVKPDFWTDEKIVELSFEARLLFIGMWNFADDNGNLDRSSKKLKMQIFPADNIDCEPLLHSLMAHGVLTEYVVSGKTYLHINNFCKHQVINRKSKSSIPTPDSVTNQGGLTEDSLTEGKGREGNITTTLEARHTHHASNRAGAPDGAGVCDPPHDPDASPPPTLQPAVLAAKALRARGLRITAANPDLVAACDEGVSPADLEAMADCYPDKPPGYIVAACRRQRAEKAAPTPTAGDRHGNHQPSHKLTPGQRIAENIRRRHAGSPPAIAREGDR